MEVTERAEAYLMKIEPTMCGTQSCHDRTFRAAVTLVKGFGLSPGRARPILLKWLSQGTHKWSDKQIDHKLRQAEKAAQADPTGVGALRDKGGTAKDTYRPGKSRQQQPSKPAGGSWEKSKEKSRAKFDPRDLLPGPEAEHSLSEPVMFADQEITGIDTYAAPTPDVQDNPIEAIYGSKRELWRRIVTAVRESIKQANAQKGSPCAMPDTVFLDRRVVPVLPPEIDGMRVQGSDEFAAVKISWEQNEP